MSTEKLHVIVVFMSEEFLRAVKIQMLQSREELHLHTCVYQLDANAVSLPVLMYNTMSVK